MADVCLLRVTCSPGTWGSLFLSWPGNGEQNARTSQDFLSLFLMMSEPNTFPLAPERRAQDIVNSFPRVVVSNGHKLCA